MVEIVPNWHPLLVHFTIALLTIATLLFIAAAFARPLALSAGIPIMPLILVMFFIVLLRRVGENPRAG